MVKMERTLEHILAFLINFTRFINIPEKNGAGAVLWGPAGHGPYSYAWVPIDPNQTYTLYMLYTLR